jgi:hypothetical protein
MPGRPGLGTRTGLQRWPRGKKAWLTPDDFRRLVALNKVAPVVYGKTDPETWIGGAFRVRVLSKSPQPLKNGCDVVEVESFMIALRRKKLWVYRVIGRDPDAIHIGWRYGNPYTTAVSLDREETAEWNALDVGGAQ